MFLSLPSSLSKKTKQNKTNEQRTKESIILNASHHAIYSRRSKLKDVFVIEVSKFWKTGHNKVLSISMGFFHYDQWLAGRPVSEVVGASVSSSVYTRGLRETACFLHVWSLGQRLTYRKWSINAGCYYSEGRHWHVPPLQYTNQHPGAVRSQGHLESGADPNPGVQQSGWLFILTSFRGGRLRIIILIQAKPLTLFISPTKIIF